MLPIGLLIAAVFCAVQAVRSPRLLVAALWLAGLSALVALLLYLLGAPEIAVVELSVGAGLVTVLFVFAISMAGEDRVAPPALVARPLALVLAAGAVLLLASLLVLPGPQTAGTGEASFRSVLWDNRAADILVQVVLIFAGVLAVLGLLAEMPASQPAAVPEETVNILDDTNTEPYSASQPEALLEEEPV